MSQRNSAVTDQAGATDPEKLAVCTVLEAINRISGKWAISILLEASRGPARFTELERAMPSISRRMLTLTLRNLERDGLLVRTVYPTVPPRVEYEATPMARELYDSLSGVVDWAERHHEAIALAREAYDGHAGCAPARK